MDHPPSDTLSLALRHPERPIDPGVLSAVYEELRRLAASFMRKEREGHTLQPTALVNEAMLRMLSAEAVTESNRERFMALAAKMMRQVLVDSARKYRAEKRGGGWQRLTLTQIPTPSGSQELDLLALDVALSRLAMEDSRMAEIVELQYFGGLNGEATADALGISRSTVKRDLSVARRWLLREIDRIQSEEP